MFPCPICDVKLNSAEQMKAHCLGKNHIKRLAARDKALELGTDFDSTPDYCNVCNVPLTSKMTAIDHFKGKMHQKKVKAVEDLRQGFRSFCDVCDVRLQSLKVSESHFNGKQHRKRERKMNSARAKEKNMTLERKPKGSRSKRACDVPHVETSSDVANVKRSGSSSTWESLNCDRDNEAKDLLSEFRSSLSGKSNSSSPETPHSSSPRESKESHFSFEKATVSQKTSLVSSKLSSYDSCNGFFEDKNDQVHASSSVFENATPSRAVDASGDSVRPAKSVHYPNTTRKETFEMKAGLWTSRAKPASQPSYLHETVTSSSREGVQEHARLQIKNGLVGQKQDLKQTQAVLHALHHCVYPVSCVDIARKIGSVSVCEVSSVLAELERRRIVSKSGCTPTLWFPETRVRVEEPCEGACLSPSLNGMYQAEKYPKNSCGDAFMFQRAKNADLIKNTEPTSAFSTTTQVFPSAILSASPSYVTTTTSCRTVQPIRIAQVIESNLVNLFQQNGSMTMTEISKKTGFPDEGSLRYVVQRLLERRVVVEEGGTPPKWRLASGSRSNSVGVIGEERKRRSPVQNTATSQETVGDRTPSPPERNDFDKPISAGFGRVAELKVGTSPQKQDHSFCNQPKPGSMFQDHRFITPTSIPNPNDIQWQRSSEVSCYYSNHSQTSSHGKRNELRGHASRPSPSPPVPIQTETSDFLDDLTETTPSSYQRELYEQAMQEDVVCYLPTGTGQGVVMAQVVHHMLLLNPTKQALVVVQDTVTALNCAQCLRKELAGRHQKHRINVSLFSGQLKQTNGKAQVVVVTSSYCLCLLNCGALPWKDVCLLVFHRALLCSSDDPSRQILRDYYMKAKMGPNDAHVPKLLGFVDSSDGESDLPKTVEKINNVLASMGDVFLSSVSQFREELEESKKQAMFVCVSASLSKEEQRMFAALQKYLALVFENLAAQCQSLNYYRDLLKVSFQGYPIDGEAFARLVCLTGQPLEKRLPSSCLKTWRHYLAICEVIFALVECGEDLAKDSLANLSHGAFGFSWANDAGLPADELALQLLSETVPKKPFWGFNGSRLLGSGVRELLDQLMIVQWENARVSSERPLALVMVKLSRTAKALASFLARYPGLTKRNVKTTFIDGTRSSQQKAVVSAIKRRQYQVIVSSDDMEDTLDLFHCELVILLDQPTTTSALARLRKRQGTNLVAICQDPDGELKLKELLKKEELVEKAIAVIRGVSST